MWKLSIKYCRVARNTAIHMIKTNWEQAWKGGSTLDWWYVTWCFWTHLSMPKHMFYIVELFRTPKPSARKRFHQMAFIFNKCFLLPQYIIIRLLYWSGGCYNHPFSVYSGAWPIPTVGPTCLIHVFFPHVLQPKCRCPLFGACAAPNAGSYGKQLAGNWNSHSSL